MTQDEAHAAIASATHVMADIQRRATAVLAARPPTAQRSDPEDDASQPLRQADEDETRPRPSARRRLRKGRCCVHVCVFVTSLVAVLMIIVPVLVIIALQPGVMRSIVARVLPSAIIGDISIGGFNSATATTVMYTISGSCVVAETVTVSIAPSSVISWAFGAVTGGVLIYSLDITGGDVHRGACVAPLTATIAPPPSPTSGSDDGDIAQALHVVLGEAETDNASWTFDWAAAARTMLRNGPRDVRLASRMLRIIVGVMSAMRRIACFITADLNRATVTSANGLFRITGSAVAVRGRSSQWRTLVSYSGSPDFALGVAYDTTAGCTDQSFGVRASSRSYGGATAELACFSPAAAQELACTVSFVAQTWRIAAVRVTADMFGHVFAPTAAFNASGWIAVVRPTLRIPSPFSVTKTTELNIATATAPPGALGNPVGVFMEQSDDSACSAIFMDAPDSAVRAGAWTATRGQIVGAVSDPAGTIALKALSQTTVSVDVRPATVLPTAVAFGPRVAAGLSGAPGWTLDAAIDAAHVSIDAAARHVGVWGSAPLPPFDGSGNYRLLFDSFEIAPTTGVGATCDSLVLDPEQSGATAVIAGPCVGQLTTATDTALDATCASAWVTHIATFANATLRVAARNATVGVVVRLSSRNVVLWTGHVVDGSFTLDLHLK